jgi:hypothetical protein
MMAAQDTAAAKSFYFDEGNAGRLSRHIQQQRYWTKTRSATPVFPFSGHLAYSDNFRSTRAEFFDPNAMQLQIACSISAFRPACGT